MKSLVLILSLYATSTFAATEKLVWNCDNGSDIEGAGISQSKTGLTGSIQWDCMPGDGICTAQSAVQESTDPNGNTVYTGKAFKLVIETSQAADAKGEYKAHMTATDLIDGKNEGRGLKFNDDVTCKK